MTTDTDSPARARLRAFLSSAQGRVAAVTLAAILVHLALVAFGAPDPWPDLPLYLVVVIGGLPLVWQVARGIVRREAGTDLLAGMSIVTAGALGQWLVAAIIVLMMAGGEALEAAASARASEVLDALARRAPSLAHRMTANGLADIPAAEVETGDRVVVLPQEICPVDGEVVDGHGTMDESYLTGEPYVIDKFPGSAVMSGAINGESALTIRATKRAADSRYAQIVGVLAQAEQERPRMRRLADRLGGWYTALALAVAIAGWVWSADPDRFLAVLVIATPCPLLIGVPVAIIGAISLAARNAIIIKDPGMLEEVGRVETIMFDKTGTLTYGRPSLTEVITPPGFDRDDVVLRAGALERYSRHPLAGAIVAAADALDRPYPNVERLAERPGQGLVGLVGGHEVRVTSRNQLIGSTSDTAHALPALAGGLECVVLIDGEYAATFRFRDEPRSGAGPFVSHLPRRHGITSTMLISGDRESEARYLADRVGIDTVHAECSPEQKLEIVRRATALRRTLFLGDGVNDAPAMTAATVGVAFGRNSDVTAEAAAAVVLDSSLERLDELLHIGARMRRIALQSALGGMGLALAGMGLAAFGLLAPVAGAIMQEVIDLGAILNSARVAARRTPMTDFAEDRHQASVEVATG
ncbi:MAG: heavy metal translocating P-type ATPase [Actinomycetes bacterium]